MLVYLEESERNRGYVEYLIVCATNSSVPRFYYAPRLERRKTYREKTLDSDEGTVENFVRFIV